MRRRGSRADDGLRGTTPVPSRHGAGRGSCWAGAIVRALRADAPFRLEGLVRGRPGHVIQTSRDVGMTRRARGVVIALPAKRWRGGTAGGRLCGRRSTSPSSPRRDDECNRETRTTADARRQPHAPLTARWWITPIAVVRAWLLLGGRSSHDVPCAPGRSFWADSAERRQGRFDCRVANEGRRLRGVRVCWRPDSRV
jgi:hypothetical protein